MTISRRRFLRMAGTGFVALSAAPALAADAFSEIEKMKKEAFAEYNAMVQESFAELERMTQQAYAEARVEIGNTWGAGEAKLPQAKQWVGYDDKTGGRVIVDYENETIRLEAPAPKGVTPEQDAKFMQELGSRILSSNSAQQDAMDPVRNRIKMPGLTPTAKPDDMTDVGRLILHKNQKKNSQNLSQQIKQQGQVKRRPVNTLLGKKNLVSVEIPFNPNAKRLNAKVLKKPVDQNAGRFRIPDELVMSVIENESSFNPRAISPIPAYGLMQLVPRTGGADAYEFVYGKERIVDMDYLFNPLNNIELGSAYLHLLHYRYFKHIKNQESRLYCSIAGYNTGPGNVSRAFTGTKKLSRLAPAVNTLTPKQVYSRLRADLPYDETRRYLMKVTKSMGKYR